MENSHVLDEDFTSSLVPENIDLQHFTPWIRGLEDFLALVDGIQVRNRTWGLAGCLLPLL